MVHLSQRINPLYSRREECLSGNDDVGFCCLAHFLTSSRLTLLFSQTRRKSDNVYIVGMRATRYLKKTYACVDYVGAADREFLEYLDEEYSRVVPYSEGVVHLRNEDFQALYADAKRLPLKLIKNESLNDLRPVVDRILRENGMGPNSPTSIERDDFETSPTLEKDPEANDCSELWIYCVDRKWHEVSEVNAFFPNKDWRVVQLEDGNLIRVHWHDCSNLLTRCERYPDLIPAESIDRIFEIQKYVYRCMDGYFEYYFSHENEGNLFPFSNSDLARGQTIDTDWSEVRSGIAQAIVSGQTVLPCDVEAGYSLIDRIFNSHDSSVEESESDQESLHRIPRPFHIATVAKEVGASKPNQIVRCMIPNKDGLCYSGFRGVTWNKRKSCWELRLPRNTRGRKKISFKARSLDPRDIETACDVAVNAWEESHGCKAAPPPARNMVPDEFGMCYSGIRGICWRKGNCSWVVDYKGNKNDKRISQSVKPRSMSPKDIEVACIEAENILNSLKKLAASH